MNYKGIKDRTWHCLNCNTEQKWRGQGHSHKYCNVTCQKEYEYKMRIHDWLNGDKNWGSSKIPEWTKRYLKESRGDCCSVCKITNWQGKELVLECDHIDGNHKNNKPENLRMICPNCHSQTNTYKNRNTGKGRSQRRG